MPVIVQCAHCNKDVRKHPSDIHGHSAYFCSRECQTLWQRASRVNAGENNPRWKGNQVPVACNVCSKVFRVQPGHLQRFAHHFCSTTCKSQWHSLQKSGENSPTWKGGIPEQTCSECGKVFRPVSHVSKKRTPKNYFCSRACKGIWTSRHLVGERAARWKGGKAEYYGPNWLQQSRKARARDDHRCRLCGSNKGQRGKALDVHHITPFKSFGYTPGENNLYLQANEINNLITLCPACHKAIEAGALLNLKQVQFE